MSCSKDKCRPFFLADKYNNRLLRPLLCQHNGIIVIKDQGKASL